MKALENQVAIVTGGRAASARPSPCASRASGAKVVIDYARNAEAAEATLAEIVASGGEGVCCKATWPIRPPPRRW